MDFRHLIVTCLFSMLRLSFENQKNKKNYAIFSKKSNEYQIECTPYGEYYAFLTDYHQCCTYGETAEEALETLSDIADEFFCEINEVYLAEEFA